MEKIGNMQITDNKENKFFCFPMISMTCTGAHGIEPESREDIPRRGLFVILVAAITVGLGRIEMVRSIFVIMK